PAQTLLRPVACQAKPRSIVLATICVKLSRLKICEPAQGAQSGHEAVLAASGNDEPWYALQPATDRPPREGKYAGSIVRSAHRILLGGSAAEEDPVVDPLRLHELELPLQMRSDEGEHDAPVGIVVFQHSFRERGTVRRPAADHSV